MKRIIFLVLAALCAMLHSESIEVSGNLSGTNFWNADTVFVIGDIHLDQESNLTIDSGTSVIFMDAFSFTSEGVIDANGCPQDSIRFTAYSADGIHRQWKGIHLIGATGDFLHCVFEDVDGYDGAYYYMGGAIQARDGGNLILDQCRISDCVASCGAGVSLSRSECEIIDCIFTNNIAELDGGALYVENSQLQVHGCAFIANQAMDGAGFLINHCEDLILIEDNIFRANIASRSGAGGLAIVSTLRFEECEFIDNVAGLYGGAMLLDMNDFDAVQCLFRNNQGIRGGAIYIFMGYYDFETCIFDRNSATYGGALHTREANIYPAIVNCLFTANTAQYGGAFYGQEKNKPYFYNCTFAANQASSGSVLYSMRVTSYFINCLMWGNPSDDSYVYYHEHLTTGSPCFYNSLIEGGEDAVGGPGISPGSFNYIDMQEGDPLYVLEGDHPYSIQEGSCAIDKGHPDSSANPLTAFDIAGNERVVNNRIDIGCYEFQGPDTQPTPSEPRNPGIVVTMSNPYRPGSVINLSIGDSGKVEVVIYNIRGQRVKCLFNDNVAGSLNLPVVWNGTDKQNRPVATGVYFCRAIYRGRSNTRKILLMR